jgi:hypothetical protein
MKRIIIALAGFSLVAFAVPALAGEVTGNGSKNDFSNGRSICKFSGLNDIPGGDETEGPAGRTQSFGQDVRMDLYDPSSLDPDGGFQFHPGWFCDPNNFDASEL